MASKESGKVPIMNGSNIPWIIEWLWVPLWVGVVELFRRAFSHESRVSILERIEQERKASNKDLSDALQSHNTSIGERLGRIESILMNHGKD